MGLFFYREVRKNINILVISEGWQTQWWYSKECEMRLCLDLQNGPWRTEISYGYPYICLIGNYFTCDCDTGIQ